MLLTQCSRALRVIELASTILSLQILTRSTQESQILSMLLLSLYLARSSLRLLGTYLLYQSLVSLSYIAIPFDYSMLTHRIVLIKCIKESVKFACTSNISNSSVTLRQHTNVEYEEKNVEISLTKPVALTFSLKYLVNFCKAASLSSQVKLCLSNEVPLLVKYSLANNLYLRFYLASKVSTIEYPCLYNSY